MGNLGRFDEAIRIWQLGLQIDPKDQRFIEYINKASVLNHRRGL